MFFSLNFRHSQNAHLTFFIFLGSFDLFFINFLTAQNEIKKNKNQTEQVLLTDKQNDDVLNIVKAIDSSFAIVKAIDDSMQDDEDAADGGSGGGVANTTNWKGER